MKATGFEKHLVIINTLLLVVVSFTMLLPIIHVLAVSLSSPYAVEANLVSLYPNKLTFESWGHILAKMDLWKSLLINIYITVVGTIISVFFSSLMAYPLARKDFRIRN